MAPSQTVTTEKNQASASLSAFSTKPLVENTVTFTVTLLYCYLLPLPSGRQDQIQSNGPAAKSNRNLSVNASTSSNKLVAMPFELNTVESEINFSDAIVL